jgi:hypothetical protein
VELAVALLIGALLITVVFQMVSGQVRITAVQSAREETQQNTRGALEIMTSELRSAVPAGILSADAQSITFMQPRAWGLLCSAAVLATQIDVAIPDVGADAAWAVSPASGVLVRSGSTYSPAPTSGIAGRAQITGSAEQATAGCPLNPAGGVKVVRLTLSRPVTGSAADPVALYTLTRYDVAAVNGVSWLRRNSGVDATGGFVPQPLAGPLVADAFNLEYRDAVGTVIGAPVPAASLANIRQVRIRVTTQSSQRINGTAQQDAGETLVTLRN